jgi:hypothetical protein
MLLKDIHADSMARHVGTPFKVVDERFTGLSLVLKEIVTQVNTDNLETFSLLFHGPLEFFLPQGIHKLEHIDLGELEPFLVPVGKDKDGYQYEAVFNRMKRIFYEAKA